MAPLSESDDEHVTEIASRVTGARNRAQYRPTAEQKELLVRAAGLAGQTLSDFMRTAVEDRARRVIAEHERIALSARARDTFLAALAQPPQPNDRLIALMERYAREVRSRP
jgi:uncharacterized protein (DUF1778 family)